MVLYDIPSSFIMDAGGVFMKKFLCGFLLGGMIFMAIPSMANDLIGKSIEGMIPVYLHGNRVAKDAIIIDSTSYLPVRALGEALGMDVRFENGQVLVERKPNKDNRKIFDYKIKSNAFNFKDEMPVFSPFEENGEIYIPTGLLYTADRDRLQDEGKLHFFNARAFIKISDFGLKAVIRDGVMWLE